MVNDLFFAGKTFYTELVWIFSRTRALNPADNYEQRVSIFFSVFLLV